MLEPDGEADHVGNRSGADVARPGDDGTDDPEASQERVLRRYELADALADAGFGSVLVLSHESADRALTPSRRRIVETLADGDVRSQRDLADRLDRDPGNVKRDLDVLARENVVRFETDGRAKRPRLKYDTVVEEPLVASSAD